MKLKKPSKTKKSRERIQEEIGDLLHLGLSLCDFAGFDVEDTLSKVDVNFRKRMKALKKLTHDLGKSSLHGQSLEYMLELWHKAKNHGR